MQIPSVRTAHTSDVKPSQSLAEVSEPSPRVSIVPPGTVNPKPVALATSMNTTAHSLTRATIELGDTQSSRPRSYGRPIQNMVPPDTTNEFVQQVWRHFDHWDSNGNGEISLQEVDQVLMNPNIEGKTAAMAGALRSLHKDLVFGSDDTYGAESGVTHNDLLAISEKNDPEGLRALTRAKNLEVKLQTAPNEVFAKQGPQQNSVFQGFFGDCSLVAVLASLVASRPDEVRQMISEQPYGGYMVSFPGREAVFVPEFTEGELAVYSSSDGLWLPILEKAAGIVLGHTDDQTMAIESASARTMKEVNELVTGEDAKRFYLPFRFWDRSITHELKVAQGLGLVITAASYTDYHVAAPTVKSNGMVNQHAYTVVGYNDDTQLIKLRNPWGATEFTGKYTDGVNDGVFEMTIDEFRQEFRHFTVELP